MISWLWDRFLGQVSACSGTHTEILINVVYIFFKGSFIYIYMYYNSLYQHHTCYLFMCFLVVIMYIGVVFRDVHSHVHMYKTMYIII